MKTPMLIVLSLTLFSCSGTKDKNDAAGKYKLKGKVKSVVTSTYQAVDNFGKIERGKFFNRHILAFDQFGNLTSEEVYDNIPGNESANYNKYVYKYNPYHEKVSCNRYCKDAGFNQTANYKYDDKHNLIEEVWSGSLNAKKSFRYDLKGALVEDSFSTIGGVMVTRYFYNNDGNLTKSMHDGGSYSTYEYDRKGDLTLETSYNSDGSLISGGAYVGHEYHYKEEHEYSSFDKRNNWLKRTPRYNQNKPYTITEREIEYY